VDDIWEITQNLIAIDPPKSENLTLYFDCLIKARRNKATDNLHELLSIGFGRADLTLRDNLIMAVLNNINELR
jgi:hypothetical protein